MFLPVKKLNKFRHYWFTDDYFRFLVYNSFTINHICDWIFTQYQFEWRTQDYWDARITNDEAKFFLGGLIFPSRCVLSLKNFNSFGKELSLNGRWFSFWKKMLECNFQIGGINLRDWNILSSFELHFFHLGREKKILPSVYVRSEQKALYLMGRDFSYPGISKVFRALLG
jgi:hypothetical protein